MLNVIAAFSVIFLLIYFIINLKIFLSIFCEKIIEAELTAFFYFSFKILKFSELESNVR